MRWRASPATAVAVTIAVGLVGNLATNTVDLEGRWWPPTVWTAAVMLVVAAVVIEWGRTQPNAPVSRSGLDEARRTSLTDSVGPGHHSVDLGPARAAGGPAA